MGFAVKSGSEKGVSRRGSEKGIKNFRKPLKTSETLPLNRGPLRDPPSQRQISLSEALGPVAPNLSPTLGP